VQQEQLTLKLGTNVRDPSGERYVIERLLGKGGFSAVYLVRDRRDRQRLFALKEVINPDERDRERFIFEGELLKRLDHRSLPHVYQVFENDKLKRVYILMDYIKGRDLKALREEQPEKRFSLPLVMALMAPIVDAIMYLHRQDPPIVHRDIKPANIIVPVGAYEAILVDFGSAKESLPDETTDIIRHGSPGYAPLEQYRGGTNPQTDIYGLGATFYTLLTGTIPADAIIRAEASKRFDPLEPAHLIVPEVTWAVATVIERAMSISREDRFETVDQFWQELTAYAPKQQENRAALIAGITSRPLPPPGQNAVTVTPARSSSQQHIPLVRRGRTFLTLILALLLILIIGAGLFVAFEGHPRPLAVLHKVTPTLVPPTLTHESSIYPQLASSYAGTGLDLMNSEKTPIYLTQLQQSQGKIRGYFHGLGLAGPFTGTVAPDGQVHFTVKDSTADLTIAFEGVIKIGGDIVGTFAVLDQNGTRTGESGLWNLAANP
jgi:eukaryotic-like serine/threonine-protein kinase